MKLWKGFVSFKSFFFLLLGVAILMLFANLGLLPLWGSEGRWAVIARSMLRSGNLLSPALGIEYYWDKPLLSYWQILPFAYIHGGVSEFTARFPSVVWAVVMLLLTYHFAKRWFGEQTALMSMGILATSYGFVFWGRNAQVEMTNAVLLALLGATTIASTIKKYVWGMIGSVAAVWLLYMLGIIPLIAEGPNLKTQIAEVSALGRPCGFLNIDNAKIIFYLDKPYQAFYDEAHAFDWAKREGGVLITSSVVSDQFWDCIVKGKNWQAVIPHKVRSLEEPPAVRDD